MLNQQLRHQYSLPVLRTNAADCEAGRGQLAARVDVTLPVEREERWGGRGGIDDADVAR
jgi:hypothetical protein